MSTETLETEAISEGVSRSVPVGPDAPGIARRFVRDELDDLGDHVADGALVDHAELLVSEVVTVATLHSGSEEATVAVVADGKRVRVEVSDAHRGFGLENDGPGLGLTIVDWVAPRWGVDLSEPGKTVWFELEADAP